MTQLSNAQEAAVEAALAKLDLVAKVAILSGQDFWTLPAMPQAGLASMVMSDGPVGVRGTTWAAEDPSIALPSPTALAATWDTGLARLAGRLLGQEARRKGVHVVLAPTVNLQRSPLGGRHFEAFSEDPLLTAQIGAGYVAGVQDQGVAATVKHFVGNDAETQRFTVSVQVTEQVLRELYLVPFETIVREASAWAVMSAYNSVNGTTMTEHEPLQLGVLKREWAFDGCIVSDWLAARDAVGTASGGLDIAMPSLRSPWGDRLVAAVRDGLVPADTIDEQARRVLRLAARVGALAGAPESVPPASRPPAIDGAALARQIGARSVVLAANPARLLPLDVGTLSSVALIGALARDPRVQGGGSATVFPRRVVSPLDGLAAALPDSVKLSFAIGADPRERLGPAAAPHWTGLRVTFRDAGGRVLHENALATGAGRWLQLPDGVDTDTLATVEIFGRLTAEVEGTHQLGVRGTGDFVLMAAGRILFDGGGERAAGDAASTFLAPPDRRIAVQLTAGSVTDVSLTQRVTLLPGFPAVSLSLCYAPPVATPDELLAEAEAVASAADVAVVVVGTTEEVESEGFDRTTLRLPGRQDELVRRVAAANSRTAVVVTAGSPVELPWADDVAAVVLAWFGGQECGHALADVLLGTVEPGGRLPTTWPARESDCPVLDTTPDGGGVLRYDEGVFIGYRGYERAAIAPRYPFGHGLGYTTWAYDQIRADARQATITVRNTGSRAGREVVQVYAGPAEPDPDRPARWLAGFAAVTAGPGESRTVTIELPERTFQRWVARRTGGGWQTIPGEYVIEAARGRGDIRLATSVRVG